MNAGWLPGAVISHTLHRSLGGSLSLQLLLGERVRVASLKTVSHHSRAALPQLHPSQHNSLLTSANGGDQLCGLNWGDLHLPLIGLHSQ